MEILDKISSHIYFNFYSFGTLLVSIFTFLLAGFYLTLPNKSRSTLHLGIAFFLLFLFTTGYFFAAAFYVKEAAFHRWITGGAILPAIIHFGQFFFHYERNTHPRVAKAFLLVQWGIAILLILYFFSVTYSSPKKFHFTGHYWDFDAEPVSKLLAIFIVIFSLINFLFIGVWKAFIFKGRDRLIILMLVAATLVAATVPNITNLKSRDGALERSTYLLALVISFVIGFFLVSVIYINSTRDRTTFMAKIVGITLVTILLIMQTLSYFTMKDQDKDYDSTKVSQLERILYHNEYYKDVDYVLSLDLDQEKVHKTRYSDTLLLDIPLVQIDFENTAIYDSIVRLPTQSFRDEIGKLLQKTHPEFYGYRKTIELLLAEYSHYSDEELKTKLIDYLAVLNRNAFVAGNKISAFSSDSFCSDVTKFLESDKNIRYFREVINSKLSDCKWEGKELSSADLKREILKYFRHFKPSLTRIYRKSLHGFEFERHFVSYIFIDPYTKKGAEVGFSYLSYREAMHSLAKSEQIVLLLVIFGILAVYPFFFMGSLINPLADLLKGVEKVNKGNLEVEVPVMVQDEIGFLADSFNNMVISIRNARSELQNYAENLEDKVKERTKEVQEKMDEVQKLKDQQDGDYYLTSLLAKPLFTNRNKSEIVKTDFFIKQKKKFQFRNRESELGGDICISGNLRLGVKDNFKRYTFALNGDAMGKSMQGAGGSLVMGVVVNSILARSARNDWVLDSTPEKWLTDLYYEVNRIFKSFNGSMVISCVAILIDDETGDMFYFNAEHPFSVLYRDGMATFIETGLTLRKLGLDSEIPFDVHKTKLVAGDVVIVASDGRDDLNLTPDESFKTINEDETLFLSHVVKGDGDINAIYESICQTGEITDDLSILRICYNEKGLVKKQSQFLRDNYSNEVEKIYERSKELLKESNFSEAYRLLSIAYESNPDHQKIVKLLGLVAFKSKDYHRSVEIMQKYLVKDPLYTEFWYYLGVGQKKLGNYAKAEEISKQLFNMQPDHVMNILNIADIKRMLGEKEVALEFTRKALLLEPENTTALRLEKILTIDETKPRIKAIES
jgi:HAMP domain-containing protein